LGDDKFALPNKSVRSVPFQDFQFLNNMVLEVSDAEAEASPQLTSADQSAGDQSSTGDPFDADDSFLVQCSQAIEDTVTSVSHSHRSTDTSVNHSHRTTDTFTNTNANDSHRSTDSNGHHSHRTTDTNANHRFKVPETKPAVSKPDLRADSTVFDEDDSEEFEMLLSQIEIPAEATRVQVPILRITFNFQESTCHPPPKKNTLK
jgi:hypothetical protein